MNLVCKQGITVKSELKFLIDFAEHVLIGFKGGGHFWFSINGLNFSSLILRLFNQIMIDSLFHLTSISLF